MLTGFGRVAFRQLGIDDAAAFDAALDISFAPKNSETQIMIDTSLVTLEEVVAKYGKEKTADQAKIMYHKLVPTIDDAFDLERSFEVIARPKDISQQASCTASSFAAYLSLKVWMKADWYDIFWVCKWAPSGLMPVRPVVVTTKQIEIPAKSALPF